MASMEEFEIGDRVKLVNHNTWEEERYHQRSPIGSQGAIEEIIPTHLRVKFDHLDQPIWCKPENLEKISQAKEDNIVVHMVSLNPNPSRLQLILQEKARRNE